MKKASITALAFVMAFSVGAFAATTKKTETTTTTTESQSTIKIDEVSGQKNKVEGDIDQEITNKKMRAESGSKSKYSLSTTLNYNGGSLEKPIHTVRPNLYASSGKETVSAMSVGASLRYRASKNDSFTLGVSAGAITPLQGNVNGGDQYQVYDPSIGYAKVFQAGGFQNIFNLGVSAGTSKVSLADDQIASPGMAYTLMKGFQNGLSLGVAADISYYFYKNGPGENKNNVIANGDYGGDRRTEYDFGIYPMAEYEMTDKLSLRTVFRYTSWFHRIGDNENSILHEVGTQSFGVGWSVARDIYLYPNIQFLWQDLESDRTNVALSATANIF